MWDRPGCAHQCAQPQLQQPEGMPCRGAIEIETAMAAADT
jgi:hypothetical protein